MKYYLSGSISNGGTKESTFERFHEAEARLRTKGHEVFNPATWEQEEERSWEWYLARDLKLIYEQRPTLYMLIGWEVSKGARLELEFAKLLGLTVEFEPSLEQPQINSKQARRKVKKCYKQPLQRCG